LRPTIIHRPQFIEKRSSTHISMFGMASFGFFRTF